MITVFDNLNPESLYWLGYLLGDGSIYNNSISLTSIDKPVVKEFIRFINVRKSYRTTIPYIDDRGISHSEIYEVKFTDKYAADRLRTLGMIENKTPIVTVPIELIYNSHIWRGYVEANGHIRLDLQGRTIVEVTSGSKKLCEQFIVFVKTINPLFKGNVTAEKDKNAFRVRLCGKYGALLLKDLYKDYKFSIPRKEKKVKECLNFQSDKIKVLESLPNCSHCNSNKVVKDGKSSLGYQRFTCRDCNRRFNPNLELAVI
jgi:hypothetical protein